MVLGGILAVPATRHQLADTLPTSLRIRAEAMRFGISIDHSVRIAMPDGVQLAASLYMPRGRASPGPAVLVRLPYGRREFAEAYNAGLFFARHGYAVLVEDLRGTGESGGELLPWRDAGGDGKATLDWMTGQSWSNGKVGTFGCSALGETQLVLAARNERAHVALITTGAGGAIGSMQGRYGYFGLFEGGVFQLASGFGWFSQHGTKDPAAPAAENFDRQQALMGLPLAELVTRVRPAPNGFEDFLRTPLGDPAWEDWGYLTDQSQLAMPALMINDWYDQTVGDNLVMAEHFRRSDSPAAAQHRVVIAPGVHCEYEEFFPPKIFGDAADSVAAWREWYLRWFDHWLRGQGPGLAALAPYNFYMLKEDRWYESGAWPPESAVIQRWHLGSGGHANTSAGDGVLTLTSPLVGATDSFRYDPKDPVPSRGGPLCCTGDRSERHGAVDQREVERRADVLVYTSAPLELDLRIAGPLKAVLRFSSNAPDTDLVARLVDLSPDGTALNIQEGALRLRYRDGLPAQPLVDGERYTVSVDMRSIAYRVARGHRLRLDLTSSSFPRLERNLNTGEDNYRSVGERVATNYLHHGPGELAYVELSALP
jgi:uncharacterized protein